MSTRPVVRDMKAPDSGAPFVCPSCGVSLDDSRPVELRTVRLPCRCHRGHIVHECRCRACSAVFLMEQLQRFYERVPPYLRERGKDDAREYVLKMVFGFYRLILRGEIEGRAQPLTFA